METEIIRRSYLRSFAIAVDRLFCSLFGGDPDLTMSQTVGLALLNGTYWAKVISPILSLINNEHHHAVRSLFDDSGNPLFADRMPITAPKTNPYDYKAFFSL